MLCQIDHHAQRISSSRWNHHILLPFLSKLFQKSVDLNKNCFRYFPFSTLKQCSINICRHQFDHVFSILSSPVPFVKYPFPLLPTMITSFYCICKAPNVSNSSVMSPNLYAAMLSSAWQLIFSSFFQIWPVFFSCCRSILSLYGTENSVRIRKYAGIEDFYHEIF